MGKKKKKYEVLLNYAEDCAEFVKSESFTDIILDEIESRKIKKDNMILLLHMGDNSAYKTEILKRKKQFFVTTNKISVDECTNLAISLKNGGMA